MRTRTWILALLAATSVPGGNTSAQDTAKAQGESAEKWKTEEIVIFGNPATVAVGAYVSAVARPDETPQARVMVACHSVCIRFHGLPRFVR